MLLNPEPSEELSCDQYDEEWKIRYDQLLEIKEYFNLTPKHKIPNYIADQIVKRKMRKYEELDCFMDELIDDPNCEDDLKIFAYKVRGREKDWTKFKLVRSLEYFREQVEIFENKLRELS
jgi:hypothetical protein